MADQSPSSHALTRSRAADEVQPIGVGRITREQDLVVGQPRWNDRNVVCAPIGQQPLIDQWSFGERVQPIPAAQPGLPGPARIRCDDHLSRDAAGGAQHAKKPVDRPGIRELARLLDPSICDVAALVFVGVLDLVEVGEADAAALGKAPPELLLVEFPAERTVDLF